MKESLILILSFIIYIAIFKFITIFTVEVKANLIILFSFLTSFVVFIDYKKIRFIKKLYFAKCLFFEILIFFFLCSFYSYFMSYIMGYDLFYHFNDLIIYFPLIIVFNVVLGCLGFREEKSLFVNGDRWFLIRKGILKVFFIPFIYGATFDCINKILIIDIFNYNSIDYYFFLLGLLFDVSIGLFGYTFSTNLLNNDIESIDDSIRGWVACVICYPPFIYFYQLLLNQSDSYMWKDWSVGEWYYYPWLLIIIVSWLIYGFSTICFGFKFSNLTWRGLVNTGTYRYVKHPAYLSKNIYWWLYTVPLFGVYGWDIVHNVIALIVLNLIYYARAKTEEQHLMQFPEYRAYNEWIKEYGLWASIKNIVFKANS